MAILKLPKSTTCVSSDKYDMVSAAIEACIATDAMHQQFADITELETIQNNLQMCLNALNSDCAEESLKLLNVAGDISDLLGIASEKLTVKAAQEGLGQKIIDGLKAMCKAIGGFIMRIINRVRAFFGSKQAADTKENVKEAAATISKADTTAAPARKTVKLAAIKPLTDLIGAWMNDEKVFVRACNDILLPVSSTLSETELTERLSKFEHIDHRTLFPNLAKHKAVDIVGYDGSTTTGIKGAVGINTKLASEVLKPTDTTPEEAGYYKAECQSLATLAAFICDRCSDKNVAFNAARDGEAMRTKRIAELEASVDKLASLSDDEVTTEQVAKVRDQIVREKLKTKLWGEVATFETIFYTCGMDIARLVNSNLQRVADYYGTSK